MTGALAVTRVVNASVLPELEQGAVLTDPYFDDHWYYGFREPIGLRVSDLPRLAAILGGHGVFDHWQPRSLSGYPAKRETPVLVATGAMAKKARAAGFERVSVVDWGSTVELPGGLSVEVVPAEVVAGSKTNNYVVSGGGCRVFIGTEARSLEPLRRYRASHPRVDLVIAPIDGARLLGHKLVMDPLDALDATRILGARTLIPFHYAVKSRPLLLETPFSEGDMRRLARWATDVDVVCLPTGTRWELHHPDARQASA